MALSFFNVFMDELSVMLSTLNNGSNVNGVIMNHMSYADDSVLLAARALQKIIDACVMYGSDYELKYSFKKTECVCVKTKWLKQLKCLQYFWLVKSFICLIQRAP